MTKKEINTLSDLKCGDLIKIHYKDDLKPETYKFLGIQGNKDIITETNGRSGFALICEPIDETKGFIGVPEAIFPETISFVENIKKESE